MYFSPHLCRFVFLYLISICHSYMVETLINSLANRTHLFLHSPLSSMPIPPDSPSLLLYPLVKSRVFLYLCVPGSLICRQGFAFHLWAPHFLFQTFLLKFKIIVPAVNQGCWTSLLSSQIQVPTRTQSLPFTAQPCSQISYFCYSLHFL